MLRLVWLDWKPYDFPEKVWQKMNVDRTLAQGGEGNLNDFNLSKALYNLLWPYFILPASWNPQVGMGWIQGFTELVYTIQVALFGVFEGAEGSTMMSYFSNYRIQERQPKIALSTVTDLPCPVLRSGELRGEPEAACSAQELFEWLGAVFSNAELCVWGLPGPGGLGLASHFQQGFSTLKVIVWWI